MVPKDLLMEMIEELDGYCQAHPSSASFEGFVDFLFIKKQSSGVSGVRKVGGEHLASSGRDTSAEDIGKLLGIMNRYARHYIKLAFEGSVLQTPEEFSFLIVLFSYEKMLQSELIRKNVMEKASGNEVIKRLMRMGLVVEAGKVDDKRAKPISISPLGRKVILEVLPRMKMVGQVVGGNLNGGEKKVLIHLLSKLDHYHHELFSQKGKSGLEDYLHENEDEAGFK